MVGPSWESSAEAWIDALGDAGDWARTAVLDPVMLARVERAQPDRVLDIGCGEGRFCRLLRARKVGCVGIDPTEPLITAARARDPGGDYRIALAEQLPFADASFELTVAYLSLIDIADMPAAVAEMVRVLTPGGTLLAANLAAHNSAGSWLKDDAGNRLGWLLDDYSTERPIRQQWNGIDILNWHRPLGAYLKAFLSHGLELRFFDEPLPSPSADLGGHFTRAPWFVVMEWRKPRQ